MPVMRAVLVGLATSMVALLRSGASLHPEIPVLRHQFAAFHGGGIALDSSRPTAFSGYGSRESGPASRTPSSS